MLSYLGKSSLEASLIQAQFLLNFVGIRLTVLKLGEEKGITIPKIQRLFEVRGEKPGQIRGSALARIVVK